MLSRLLLVYIIGDEMFSDIYKMKLIGDVLYEVEGKVSKYCDASFICSIWSELRWNGRV